MVYFGLQMRWTILSSKKLQKQIAKLPQSVKASLFVLLLEIEKCGPVRGN